MVKVGFLWALEVKTLPSTTTSGPCSRQTAILSADDAAAKAALVACDFQVKVAIVSIARGQVEAAIASGMTYAQRMRHIILPQAIGVTLPPLLGQAIVLVKDSALLSLISLPELTRAGQIMTSERFMPAEQLFAAIGFETMVVTETDATSGNVSGDPQIGVGTFRDVLALVDASARPSVTDCPARKRSRWLRGVFAHPAALAPPSAAPDPRLVHGYPSIWDREFIANLRGSITVPVTTGCPAVRLYVPAELRGMTELPAILRVREMDPARARRGRRGACPE